MSVKGLTRPVRYSSFWFLVVCRPAVSFACPAILSVPPMMYAVKVEVQPCVVCFSMSC